MKFFIVFSDLLFVDLVKTRSEYLKSGNKYMSMTRMIHTLLRESLAIRKYAPETNSEIARLRKKYETELAIAGDKSMGELYDDKVVKKFKPVRRDGVMITYADVLDVINHFDGVAHRKEIATKLELPEQVIYNRLKNMFSRQLVRKLNLGIYTTAKMGDDLIIHLSPKQHTALERARKWAGRQSPEDGI